jgi:hypothetical protein
MEEVLEEWQLIHPSSPAYSVFIPKLLCISWQSRQSDPFGILAQAVDPQAMHKRTLSNPVINTIFRPQALSFMIAPPLSKYRTETFENRPFFKGRELSSVGAISLGCYCGTSGQKTASRTGSTE